MTVSAQLKRFYRRRCRTSGEHPNYCAHCRDTGVAGGGTKLCRAHSARKEECAECRLPEYVWRQLHAMVRSAAMDGCDDEWVRVRELTGLSPPELRAWLRHLNPRASKRSHLDHIRPRIKWLRDIRDAAIQREAFGFWNLALLSASANRNKAAHWGFYDQKAWDARSHCLRACSTLQEAKAAQPRSAGNDPLRPWREETVDVFIA